MAVYLSIHSQILTLSLLNWFFFHCCFLSPLLVSTTPQCLALFYCSLYLNIIPLSLSILGMTPVTPQ